MSAFEDKYDILRKKLDRVGYHQPLSFGSVELVSNLLNDILLYKDGYASFKDIADELLQEFNLLKLGHKPLRQEFKHLHHENNYLTAVQEQDDFQEIRKELKTHISKFQKAYSELEIANLQHLMRIGELEDGISELKNKLIEYEKVSDYIKGKKIIKKLKLPLNEDDRSLHFLKIAEEDPKKIKAYHKSTQTKLKTSISDKHANLNTEKIEKSCQTVNELHCDYKCVGEIEEQCKQKKKNYLSQYLVENGEDIVPLQSDYEKIKAERDYYCKEYHLIEQRIIDLFLENGFSMEKEQLFCIDNIKNCLGDRLMLLIDRIGNLLKCKRAVNDIRDSELRDMVVAHQRERVVLLLKCEQLEQKMQEIKKHYQNLSSDDNKMISENNHLQKYLIKKDEELKSVISTHKKTEVKLNNALLNLVSMSTENDCLKDKIQQKENYIIKMGKNTVSLQNIIKILSELKLRAEAEVFGLRKKTEVSENEVKNLNKQLCQSSNIIDRFTKENKHLVLTVTKMNKHIRLLHQNLDLKKQRIKDLKREIHNYISEVRKVEEAIESKEQDFQRILETYSIISEEEEFALGNKHHDILETDRNSVNEHFEKNPV